MAETQKGRLKEQGLVFEDLSAADKKLVAKKLDTVAKIRALEAESAKLNVELNSRGVTNRGLACW
jgi:hypothetical protein